MSAVYATISSSLDGYVAGPDDGPRHPLGIGGREDPARLVFTAAAAPAVVIGWSDLGDRFRLTQRTDEFSCSYLIGYSRSVAIAIAPDDSA